MFTFVTVTCIFMHSRQSIKFDRTEQKSLVYFLCIDKSVDLFGRHTLIFAEERSEDLPTRQSLLRINSASLSHRQITILGPLE